MKLLTPAQFKALLRGFLLASLTFLAGCQSAFFKPTGNVLVAYSQQDAVPYTLALADPAMGCALGESFSPFLLSFERQDVDVDRVAILMQTLSGVCAQSQAWEAELRQLRALRTSDAESARDALTEKKRFEALAAQRQYQGYQRLVAAYGEPGDECPILKSDNEEFYYLIGLINGLQASQNNIAASQTAGVPMSVVNKVGRGAACLDPEKWWGVPDAIQAVVWSMQPGTAPKDFEPEALLRKASELGAKQGVRLSHVFEAEVYNAASDIDGVKQVVTAHAESMSKQAADPRLQLLDAIAGSYMLSFSDRIWTKDVGYRTPHGKYGQFWQPIEQRVEPEIEIDIDSLI